MKKFIPVNEPLIEKSDISSVKTTLQSGWISSEGKSVKIFENNFAKFIGHKYGITVANGTAALEVAVQSLNLPKQSEVIIPNFTIFSNAIACIKNDLKIIPIDCDLYDWNMNVNKIQKKITNKTRLIIATHIYNYPLAIDILKKIFKKKNIYLIEDAAEVFGQKYQNKKCGSFGDISTFSFYANKTITMGEGGIILTDKKKLFEKFQSLKNLCFGKKERYNHDDIGWNYRITNMQATLGLSQLDRIKSIVKKKKEIGKKYYQLLSKNKNIFVQKPKLKRYENAYWVVGIIIKNRKMTSKNLRRKLLKKKN